MNSTIHIWPQERKVLENTIEISTILEGIDSENQKLWFKLLVKHQASITNSMNPFLLGTIFTAMKRKKTIHVHGRISPSLLSNLMEFQAAWACMCPNMYNVVDIIVEEEKEATTKSDDLAIAAFSGGLDSCFTLWKHGITDIGRSKKNVRAALMVHGFDIPLSEKDTFERAFEKSKKIIKSAGVEPVKLAFNIRDLGNNWEHEHGAALAASLSLFSKRFSHGLIASSHDYNSLRFPWGSNVITDPMLSRQGFTIVHDGAASSRTEKAKAVAGWQEAMNNLRVCWEGEQKDRNCGLCHKCVRTALCFAAIGVLPPEALQVHDLSKLIQKIFSKRIDAIKVQRYKEILTEAQSNKIQGSWVSTLRNNTSPSLTRKLRALLPRFGNER